MLPKLRAIIKYFAEFFGSWNFQSKMAFITCIGLIIAVLLLNALNVNEIIGAGSIFGAFIAAVVISCKISIQDHREPQPQPQNQ
jgi:hypothetical protein